MADNQDLFQWFRSICPTSAMQSHAVVSGQLTYVLNLPAESASTVDYAALKMHDLMDSPEGYVWAFATFGRVASAMIKYGEITEPMSYPALGTVLPEDMDTMRRAGAEIWDAVYDTKKLIRVEFSAA